MSNTIDLEELKSNRQALLLAELAALLHDMYKCADEHIINQAADKPVGYTYKGKAALLHLLPLTLPGINLFGVNVLVKDLIKKGMPRAISKTSNPWIIRVLGRCHSVAHVEKELSDDDKETKQQKDSTRSSSPYGHEGESISGLTRSLQSLPFAEMTQRGLFISKFRRTFDHALGDTRRPLNEVTLANWSDVVASLYKSALAGGLLGVKPEPDDLHWRILRVNFDVLGLYTRAIKIADLLGYQKMVNEACEQVKQLIEVNYPLGNEVYRDTTGIYFTFPDISLPTDLEKIIRNSVTEVDEELAPRIEVTEGNGITADEKLKHILAKARDEARLILAQPFESQNYSPYWQDLWDNQCEDQKWEVCPVCRLRPVEEGLDACTACCGRRKSRIEDWQDGFERTIWIDEIADHNGRVALLACKFGLDDWLSGDLVRSMLVKAVSNNPAECRAKNPSPARLRRVWETCLRFWSETVEQGILEKYAYGQDAKQANLRHERRLIVPDKKENWNKNVAYDGLVDGKPISLFWLAKCNCFITIINLQLTGELREGQKITIGDPDHPRKKTTFTVQKVHPLGERTARYKPFLPILISPDQFLALVPAADVLKIVEQIRVEYTRQFGKVQNRLPLFFGNVFFQRKLPLLAVIDAGRRMLDRWNPADEAWVVQDKDIIADEKNLRLQLTKNGQTMGYNIPIKMGDGTTDDIWYPYFRLFANGVTNNRKYSFIKTEDDKKVGNNGVAESKQKDTQLWTHALDLRCGDTVCVRPSRFAYTYLEQTAQRFRFDPLKGLLLLDELPRLMEMWVKLKEMPEITDTKLRGIQALFEAKQHLWGPDDRPAAGVEENREPFRRLVETTFRRERIRGIGVEEVLDGSFERCLEIYLRILKQRIKEEEQDD